jgi:hypothetical protein
VVWNHLAAILFFAGPLFYCGLWMAIAPAGLANMLERILIPFGRVGMRSRIRIGVRCVGVVLTLLAIAI